MPLPKPNKDESKKDFVSRCMADENMKQEFKDNDQRLAVCNDLWSDKESKGLDSEIERRCMDIEFRVLEGEKGVLEGYAAPFNKITDLGWFRERISPGTFIDTIQNDDIRALFNHDSNFVLGRNKRAKTLELSEDEKGLKVLIHPPNTQFANDLRESIRRKDIDQMSFGFKTIEDSWDYSDEKYPLRTLKRVKLFDVSPVTFPAYKGTRISVRSFEKFLEETRKKDGGEDHENKYDLSEQYEILKQYEGIGELGGQEI